MRLVMVSMMPCDSSLYTVIELYVVVLDIRYS